MMQSAKLGILGLVIAAIFSSSAQAAPTKLPTAFNEKQHVYVMPDTKIFNPPDLDQRLVSEAAQQNLAVYVIYTIEGDEALANNFADQCLQKLLQTWSVQQGFPADNYLIIVCVQDKLHTNIWDYAAEVGSAPTKAGLSKADLNRQLDKNKSSIGLDPAGFALYSVKDIVARIAELKSGNSEPSTPAAPASGRTWLIIGGIVAALVVGGVIIFVLVRRKQRDEAHKNALAKLAAVEALKVEIENAKLPLSQVGLSFQPYESRLTQASQKADSARALLEKNPEMAETIAIEAESSLTSLLSDLRRAVELKNDKTLDVAIESAAKRITDQRAQEVVWNYPGAAEGTKQQFQLNEAGNNPDEYLASAHAERANGLTALEAGNVSEAERHFNGCRSACRSVSECIARTLSAKQRVEGEMPSILRDTTEWDKTYSEAVKTAYFAQQFVKAAQLMEQLKQLIFDRREARSVVERCGALKQRVQHELAENDRFAPYEVNQHLDRLAADLSALSNEVKQPTGDWTSLRARAEAVESGLHGVQQDIAAARSAYDSAQTAVSELARALNTLPASPVAADPTRLRVVELTDLHYQLVKELKGSKKDWTKIFQAARSGVDAVNEVRNWLQEDLQFWQAIADQDQLFNFLANPDLYTKTLNARVYNGGVAIARNDPQFIAHRQSAQQHATAARIYWARREWFGVRQELGYFAAEFQSLNLLGWWSVLQMMRDSDDHAAQHYSFQNGFRDNVTWEAWRDKFVAKQRVDNNGLWQPFSVDEWLRTGAGGADFTKAPDFKGFGGSDPWTPPTPSNPA